jgi:hypothetical protein
MKNQNTLIPRIKPKMEMRELNETEKLMAVLLSANVHGLIRDIDELEGTTLYKQKLKQTAKAFLVELEKHAYQQVWAGEVEGVDFNAATDQMDHLAFMHRNLLFTLMSAGHLHESQMTLFWQDMQMTFKRHKIPLQLTPTGELIPLSNNQTPVIIDIKQWLR